MFDRAVNFLVISFHYLLREISDVYSPGYLKSEEKEGNADVRSVCTYIRSRDKIVNAEIMQTERQIILVYL